MVVAIRGLWWSVVVVIVFLLEVLVAFVVDCSTSGVCYYLCSGKITCVWLQVYVIPFWDKNILCSV